MNITFCVFPSLEQLCWAIGGDEGGLSAVCVLSIEDYLHLRISMASTLRGSFLPQAHVDIHRHWRWTCTVGVVID